MLKNGRPLEPPRESRMTTMIYPWVVQQADSLDEKARSQCSSSVETRDMATRPATR
jgi:hypothetical protein